MRNKKITRRDRSQGRDRADRRRPCSPSRCAPRRPAPAAITPALIEAAKKEGKLAFYTAMDLDFAKRLGKAFEAKYGIAVRVERSGAERVFTRIGQEYTSNIRAVDVANTADAAHCIVWTRNGWLEPYLPEEVAQHYGKEYYDPNGLFVVDAHPGVADRLQHQPGEEGGGAQELCRPARPEMGGQDGQGRIPPTAAPS